MRAVVCEGAGGIDVLTIGEIEDPKPAVDEVVIDVVAAGVNRADLLQRQGIYPPPPGAPGTIGLEVSGTISAVGAEVEGWSVGDECCALLAGGGYAEKVVVPAPQVMPVPDGLDLVSAAALPEVVATVWSNVFMTAHLKEGETLLVHGGSSGIGTMAIQLGVAHGARVLCTVGSTDKMEFCTRLGADVAINYKEAEWASVVKEATGKAGRRRHPRHHGREVPVRQREVARVRRAAGGDRDAGRGQGRAGPRPADEPPRLDHRRRLCGSARWRTRAGSSPRWSATSGRWSRRRRCARSCTPPSPSTQVAQAHETLEQSTQIGKVLLTL